MRNFNIIISILLFVLLSAPLSIASNVENATFTTTTGKNHIRLQSSKATTLRPTVERVFSRKRRFLLLPKGAALKATIQFSKRLLAVVPRGFTFVLELALYYPCPSNRIDLIPKRLRKPTTTTPKPTGPPTPPLLVYIPGTEIRFKAKPAAKPMKVQRIDEAGGATLKWIEPKPTLTYANPQKWAQWSKHGTPAYQQKYNWTPARLPQWQQQQQQWQPSLAQQTKWTKWATPAPSTKWNKWIQPQHRWKRESEREEVEEEEVVEEPPYEDPETLEYRPMYFEDLEQFDESKHYHSHRDRRQLFAQFEPLSRFLGIDMKACVLRAVCESKRLLLPPGYSLLQDVMRLILTFPAINGLNDEYSRLMRMDFDTCHKRLRNKCNISLLAWLVQPQKVSTV